jgi:mannose-6-phosphate isomerase
MLGYPPSEEPTGEAWLVSDVEQHSSTVAEGPLKGTTLREMMVRMPERLLGRSAASHGRFPLLLKLLDAVQPLSVQVHPSDAQAKELEPQLPPLGKTEAWVVLKTEFEAELYSGLQPGLTRETLEQAMRAGKITDLLHKFYPAVGDCIFLRAGTVHAIGAGMVMFEVQQTSDITYRLDDWGRVDPKTNQPRQLHIEKGLHCANYASGPCNPVRPIPQQGQRGTTVELLVDCEYFRLWRKRLTEATRVGELKECRIVICIEGQGDLASPVAPPLSFRAGQVMLIPAETGDCTFTPSGGAATLLECGLPQR